MPGSNSSPQLVLLSLLLAACSERVEEAPRMTVGSTRAPDQVEADALVEGNIVAFGVRMPKDAIIQESTSTRISVMVPYSIERVSTFFRQRLSADSVDVGPRRTIFENARLKGVAGGDPVNVSVNRNSTSTLVHVTRDTGFVVAPDDSAVPEASKTEE